MNLLITGVAGFIGSRVARTAIEKGYKVIGVDDLSQGYLRNVPKEVHFFEFDLTKSNNTAKLPKNIDYILHLAGQSSGEVSFDNPILDLEKNTISTLNLIKFGIKNKVKKIIYASSMSVYGTAEDSPVSETHVCSPLSCYGVGKLAAENYLKVYQNQLPYTIFRMFNVYGSGQDMSNLRQGMVSIYLAHIFKDGYVPVKGSVQRFRDFIYI
ncbi:MAG TPA: NAD-dependent epimerase, partial [Coxiellaceae bacterium]|nr:NAD-dependent epimerase [Coxiellaceae bacterium]